MILIYQCIHIGQMSIMNFCKISFDFKVGSGRFRFGSFLNDRLKWSVRVVSAMPKVGASLACADTSNHIRGKQCPVHPNYGVPQAQKVAKGYSTLRHLKRATTTLELLPLGGMLNKAACF